MKNLAITVELCLPFYSRMLHPHDDYELWDMPYQGRSYSFMNLESDESKSFMQIRLSWKESEYVPAAEDNRRKLAERGIDFLNYLIHHSRTFNMETTNMVFVSLRSVRSLQLTVGENAPETIELIDDVPQQFLDLIANTDHFPESQDIFATLIQEEELEVLDFNLLVDAYHAIYESRYSESVINCLTAIESRIFPLLTKWLAGCFLNKSEKHAENNLIEMSFGSKMEILFGSIYPKSLGDKVKLLEELKGINRLRNEIIHKGRRATKLEAKRCLGVSSEFIMIVVFDNPDKDDLPE